MEHTKCNSVDCEQAISHLESIANLIGSLGYRITSEGIADDDYGAFVLLEGLLLEKHKVIKKCFYDALDEIQKLKDELAKDSK